MVRHDLITEAADTVDQAPHECSLHDSPCILSPPAKTRNSTLSLQIHMQTCLSKLTYKLTFLKATGCLDETISALETQAHIRACMATHETVRLVYSSE